MGRSLQDFGLKLYAWLFAIRGPVRWRRSRRKPTLDRC